MRLMTCGDTSRWKGETMRVDLSHPQFGALFPWHRRQRRIPRGHHVQGIGRGGNHDIRTEVACVAMIVEVSRYDQPTLK